MGETDSSTQDSGSGSDPENLLAEALRAQARSAPDSPDGGAGDRGSEPTATPSVGPPPGYGLLSGADAGSLERERAALDATGPADRSAQASETGFTQPRRALPAGWVLLLAALLGLATGSVVGLLTLL